MLTKEDPIEAEEAQEEELVTKMKGMPIRSRKETRGVGPTDLEAEGPSSKEEGKVSTTIPTR